MVEETRVEGNVSGRVYLQYFTAGCNLLVLLLIVLLSVTAEVSQSHANPSIWTLIYEIYCHFHVLIGGVHHAGLVAGVLVSPDLILI